MLLWHQAARSRVWHQGVHLHTWQHIQHGAKTLTAASEDGHTCSLHQNLRSSVVPLAHFTAPLHRLDSWKGRCRSAEALRTQNELHNQCQEAQPQQMFLVSQWDAPDPISIPRMNTVNKSLQFHLLTTSHVFCKKKFCGLSTVEKYT